MIKYPLMNYNQVLSYFKLIYPERINSYNQYDANKRAEFRKLSSNFKLNNQKRLLIFNPYKSDNDNNNNN